MILGERTLQIQLTGRSRQLATTGTVALVACILLALGSIGCHLAGSSQVPYLQLPAITFNVCFILMLSALSAIFFQRRFDLPAFTLGLMGIVLGLALLTECLAHEDLGVSDFFLDSASSAGKVASPALAFAILFSSLALALLSKARHSRLRLIGPALCVIGVLGICGIALVGDLLDTSIAGQFGGDGDTSALEPLAFALLSLGILLDVVSQIRADLSAGTRPFLPIFSGGFVLVISLLLWMWTNQNNADFMQEQIRESASEASISVLNALGNHSKRLRKLADEFPAAQGPTRVAWEGEANSVIRELADIHTFTIYEASRAPVWTAAHTGSAHAPVTNPKFAEIQSQLLANALTTRRVMYSPAVPTSRNISTLLMAEPIFEKNAPLFLMFTAVDISKLLGGLDFPEGFQVEVHEKEKPIFSRELPSAELADDHWTATTHVPSVRVNWNVKVTPTVAKIMNLEGSAPNLILVGGLLLSLITAILLHYRALWAERSAFALYNERKFQASAELSPLCLFRATPEGEFLGVNQVWQGITGLDEEECRGDGWKRSIHPDDWEKLNEAWRAGVSSGTSFELSFRLIAKDGAPYPFSGRVKIIEGAQRETAELVGALGMSKAA